MSWLDRLFGTPVQDEPGPAMALQEGLFDSPYADPDINLTASQGGSKFFRRLTQSKRDLQPFQQARMQDLAFFLYDSNPLAKRVLELTRDFVVGEGVTLTATASDEAEKQATQAVLDAFWDDPVNRMDLAVHDYALELGLFGEQLYVVAINPKDGHVRLGYLDPAEIKGVLRDPNNARLLTDVVLTGSVGGDERRLKLVRIDERPGSPSYGRLVGVETDERGAVIETYRDGDTEKLYAGAAFFFRVNSLSNATRGRSDLLALADWIDGYDQVAFGAIDRDLLIKSFIWDITVEGASQAEIQELEKRHPEAPKPGSVRWHNQKVKWEAVAPDLRVSDTQATAQLVLDTISTGSGLPKTWLNGTTDVNRATAQELGEPAFKRLVARQRYFRAMLEQIARFVLDQAELHGRLPRRPNQTNSLQPAPWTFTVNTPEMRTRDIAALGQALQQIAQAIVTLKAEGAIDEQVMRQVAILMIEQLGIEIDLGEMVARIEQATEVQAAQQAAAPYPVGPIAGNGHLP